MKGDLFGRYKDRTRYPYASPEQRRQVGEPIPRYFYHEGATVSEKGIVAYTIRETEAASFFGKGHAEAKYVWLSRNPMSERAVSVDTAKLRNEDMRFTGQAEGHMLHRGGISRRKLSGHWYSRRF